LVEHGQIDEAIVIYQRLKPVSARVLNIIGVLYCEKKADYDSAINYYKKALQIQEEVYTNKFLYSTHQRKLFFSV